MEGGKGLCRKPAAMRLSSLLFSLWVSRPLVPLLLPGLHFEYQPDLLPQWHPVRQPRVSESVRMQISAMGASNPNSEVLKDLADCETGPPPPLHPFLPFMGLAIFWFLISRILLPLLHSPGGRHSSDIG